MSEKEQLMNYSIPGRHYLHLPTRRTAEEIRESLGLNVTESPIQRLKLENLSLEAQAIVLKNYLALEGSFDAMWTTNADKSGKGSPNNSNTTDGRNSF